jgi:hypothetical protein
MRYVSLRRGERELDLVGDGGELTWLITGGI